MAKVKVNAGRYQYIVWIIPPVNDVNVESTGEPIEGHDPDKPADWDYASVEPVSSREVLNGNQSTAIQDYRVKMRYRPDITTRHQLQTRDEKNRPVLKLHITSPPIDIEGRGIELEILCTTQAPG